MRRFGTGNGAGEEGDGQALDGREEGRSEQSQKRKTEEVIFGRGNRFKSGQNRCVDRGGKDQIDLQEELVVGKGKGTARTLWTHFARRIVEKGFWP